MAELCADVQCATCRVRQRACAPATMDWSVCKCGKSVAEEVLGGTTPMRWSRLPPCKQCHQA
eukprot:195798-Chlamydomonas_euryale.AAC.1